MAKVTVTKTHVNFACVVLVGPNNERIITGTNLPQFAPRSDINDVEVPMGQLLEQAHMALAKRPKWSKEVWYVTITRKENGTIINSKVKIQGKKETWMKGWPLYMMPEPNDREARFSCKLIQKTLDNHKINLGQEQSYELDIDKVRSILDEVDAK
jgi:hypothetical protein